MKYGLSDDQFKEIGAFMAQHPEVEEAILFGSRAMDTYKEASDVDIAIKGDKADFSLAAKLKYDIEEDTYLPFFFDFLAYSTITNEELRRHIDTKGVVIYRKREAGMSEWRECKLEDVCVFQRGHDLPKTNMLSGIIPVAGSNGIIGYHTSATTKGPGITIGRSGNIGTPKFYQTDFWAHNTVLYVKDFKNNNEKFIYYFLHIFDFAGFNAGSAVPTLNRNHIHEIPILLPPLPEQRAIAAVLSSLDDKIDLLHRQNTTLEAMAETLFRQWFVEEADERWVIGKVSDYCNHHKDGIKPQDYPTRTFSHYSIPAFDNNMNPVIENGSKIQSNKYLMVPNCLLFSKLNPSKEKRIWLINDQADEDSICSTEFQVVLPKKKEYLFFIYSWLSIPQNYNEISSGAGGTSGSHQRIEPADIFNFPCPLIDDEVIQIFNAAIAPIFIKVANNRNHVGTIEKLRDTLLPKLMSGEVRVEFSLFGDKYGKS